MNENKESTPLMKQYGEIKEQYTDSLILFQVGDFYELFFDDAKRAAAYLGLALTARGKNKGEPIPLCGVPVHAINHYLSKLVTGGFKVVLCDQLELPRPGTIVKRGVTRIYTPGTLVESNLLNEKKSSYLISCFQTDNSCALVSGELLTGQLAATTIDAFDERTLEAELLLYMPDEIIIPNTSSGKKLEQLIKKLGYPIAWGESGLDDTKEQLYNQWVTKQFSQLNSIISQTLSLNNALYNFFWFLINNKYKNLEQFNSLTLYKPEDFLLIDAATQRNLELVVSNDVSNKQATLFSVIDHACTPMGSRLLKKWIMRPLLDKKLIEWRLSMVEYFFSNQSIMRSFQGFMKQMGDVERVIGRIALGRAPIQDYLSLLNALQVVPDLVSIFALVPLYYDQLSELNNFLFPLTELLNSALSVTEQSQLIKSEFDEKLAQMREVLLTVQARLASYEKSQQQLTGISTLKVRYASIHGFYIEVTKTHLAQIPAYYTRQQTLVGKERYMTPDLAQLQQEVMNASNEIGEYEKSLFIQVKKQVATFIPELRKITHLIANLDALASLAFVAYRNNYVRPTFSDMQQLAIKEGRHPVIEHIAEYSFIPNNIFMNEQEHTHIITGPNMGGKSTYMRQAALIVILAQLGSFVPADCAEIPLFDRIFSRIGAGDNLAAGKSTFFIEMEECATICKKATSKSFIIFDEVGRGTSTVDGLVLAQAIMEYIHTIGALCLFATHYHELTLLENSFSGIKNFHAVSKQTDRGILLLYKINQGVAQGSFGIEVAKIAQLPVSIIDRAQLLLENYDCSSLGTNAMSKKNNESADSSFLLAKQSKQTLIMERLATLDCAHLTPKQALDILWEFTQL